MKGRNWVHHSGLNLVDLLGLQMECLMDDCSVPHSAALKVVLRVVQTADHSAHQTADPMVAQLGLQRVVLSADSMVH